MTRNFRRNFMIFFVEKIGHFKIWFRKNNDVDARKVK